VFPAAFVVAASVVAVGEGAASFFEQATASAARTMNGGAILIVDAR
jgi:hypothetical protein